MDKAYHIEITHQALADKLSPSAYQSILVANLGQDKLRYQIGHPHIHYDDNCLAEGDSYMARQRELAVAALSEGQGPAAWVAFGRLIHSAQDFYAHSNYVKLYLEERLSSNSQAQNPNSQRLPAQEIEPLDPAILNHPSLHTGRLYYPWEVLSFIGLARLMRRLLPADSHTCMNLDNPKQGRLYEYAFWAAVKRTQVEFERLWEALGVEARATFVGE